MDSVIGGVIRLSAAAAAMLVPATTARADALQQSADRYEACLSEAERAPDRGIAQALEWRSAGGGVPARHCEAVGLFHAKEHAEAGIRFEKIAEDMRIGRDMPVIDGKRVVASAGMLANMYEQAASAWLLSRRIGRGFDAVGAGLSLVGEDSPLGQSLLLIRAELWAADENFAGAADDIRQVLAFNPARYDVLLLLASAERAQGHLREARDAITSYLKTFPDDPVGHLELGHVMEQLGGLDEARQAWLKAIQLAGEDAALTFDARANLERLDIARQTVLPE